MDCLDELCQIEQRWDGTIAEIGTILATVIDPIEQMALAVAAVKKLREKQAGEMLNFTESETVWRVALAAKNAEIKQMEGCFQTVADELLDSALNLALQHSESDKPHSRHQKPKPTGHPDQLKFLFP